MYYFKKAQLSVLILYTINFEFTSIKALKHKKNIYNLLFTIFYKFFITTKALFPYVSKEIYSDPELTFLEHLSL